MTVVAQDFDRRRRPFSDKRHKAIFVAVLDTPFASARVTSLHRNGQNGQPEVKITGGGVHKRAPVEDSKRIVQPNHGVGGHGGGQWQRLAQKLLLSAADEQLVALKTTASESKTVCWRRRAVKRLRIEPRFGQIVKDWQVKFHRRKRTLRQSGAQGGARLDITAHDGA